jgi:hypothetical protein
LGRRTGSLLLKIHFPRLREKLDMQVVVAQLWLVTAKSRSQTSIGGSTINYNWSFLVVASRAAPDKGRKQQPIGQPSPIWDRSLCGFAPYKQIYIDCDIAVRLQYIRTSTLQPCCLYCLQH